MLMIMTRAAAATIRATKSVLPEYGASSSLSHRRNHARRPAGAGNDCAMEAISMAANYDHCRPAHAKEIRRRILDAHPDGISGREMHPVQRPLHIRQSGREAADQVFVRSDAKSNAVHHARKANVRFRQHIDVRLHSGGNMQELPFAKV